MGNLLGVYTWVAYLDLSVRPLTSKAKAQGSHLHFGRKGQRINSLVTERISSYWKQNWHERDILLEKEREHFTGSYKTNKQSNKQKITIFILSDTYLWILIIFLWKNIAQSHYNDRLLKNNTSDTSYIVTYTKLHNHWSITM